MSNCVTCFNEAAAKRCGKRPAQVLVNFLSPSFNEAAAKRCGKRCLMLVPHRDRQCFNEAAAKRCGKLQGICPTLRGSIQLQ